MVKKRKNISGKRATSTKVRARRGATKATAGKAISRFGNFALPLALSAILIILLAVFGFSAFEHATNSAFFGVNSISVYGIDRTPEADIRRIIESEVEKPGVWNADLSEIRLKLEKFPFVKKASVSRILPYGIRVDVTERVPEAVVKLRSGNYLVDGEGMILVPAVSAEKELPLVLSGWDESKTEKAITDNLARLKIYRKMLDEWRQFDLLSRVSVVELSNPRSPIAIIEDSGRSISISLAREELGKSLKIAIEAVSGKGDKVKSVDSGGVSPIITYLEIK